MLCLLLLCLSVLLHVLVKLTGQFQQVLHAAVPACSSTRLLKTELKLESVNEMNVGRPGVLSPSSGLRNVWRGGDGVVPDPPQQRRVAALLLLPLLHGHKADVRKQQHIKQQQQQLQEHRSVFLWPSIGFQRQEVTSKILQEKSNRNTHTNTPVNTEYPTPHFIT